jgi:hypothetical protein
MPKFFRKSLTASCSPNFLPCLSFLAVLNGLIKPFAVDVGFDLHPDREMSTRTRSMSEMLNLTHIGNMKLSC